MRDEDIFRSLLNWFASNYAGDVDFGSVDDFDPRSEDIATFVEYYPNVLKKPSKRKGSRKEVKVSLTFRCWARGGEDILAAQKLASSITEFIEDNGTCIEVKNFDTTDEELVGRVVLWEPEAENLTDDVEESGWQRVDVTVEGRAEED